MSQLLFGLIPKSPPVKEEFEIEMVGCVIKDYNKGLVQ